MEKKGHKVLKRSITILVIIVFFVLLLVTMFNVVYIGSEVNGYSMYPTLNSKIGNSKDKVFINRFEKGSRGDIVVANIKDEPNWDHTLEGEYIIKRLIGVSGDRIKIVQNVQEYYVYINGEICYTKIYYGSVPSYSSFQSYVEENRANTERITEDGEIIVQDGEIFLMGDNWLSSYDSFRVGPLHKSSLVGRVDIVVENGDNVVWGITKGIFKMIF